MRPADGSPSLCTRTRGRFRAPIVFAGGVSQQLTVQQVLAQNVGDLTNRRSHKTAELMRTYDVNHSRHQPDKVFNSLDEFISTEGQDPETYAFHAVPDVCAERPGFSRLSSRAVG